MNGIIIDGKVYEAVHRGSYHCSDCDLYKRCVDRPVVFDALCSGLVGICNEVIMFRFSKELTDKINAKVSFDEILESNKDVLKRLKDK